MDTRILFIGGGAFVASNEIIAVADARYGFIATAKGDNSAFSDRAITRVKSTDTCNYWPHPSSTGACRFHRPLPRSRPRHVFAS